MKILLRNTQTMLGDRLMFTPVVRDVKTAYPADQIGIISAGPEIWHNNPHIDPGVTAATADVTYDIGPGDVTRGSKTNGLHITAAFRESFVKNSKKPVKQGPFKPDIFLSDAEKEYRAIDGPYWVINTDCGPFSAKRWRPQRFQELVDLMPELTFVQVGLSDDNQLRLAGANVVDMIDATKIRELFSLVYNSTGCISLVSSLMHVAAAFDKPCVVIAGGREPFTFERYANHRFLDTIGMLPCCRLNACWHNALGACEDHDKTTARCMDLIGVDQVRDAVDSYYDGGAIERPDSTWSRIETRKKSILRIAANTKCLGGAERSVLEIARMFIDKGWIVELSPAGPIAGEIADAVPPGVIVSRHLSRPCDVLLLYCSDMVFNFDHDKFAVFNRLKADRRVMALTYKIGKAGEVPWTKGWDKYLFLSTALRDQFVDKNTECRIQDTGVLAPAVDLEPFLAARPTYDGQLRIMRHSSQGDVKFPADLSELMAKCRPTLSKGGGGSMFYFLPGPTWLNCEVNVTACPYQPTARGVAEFLSKGNCFWYLLPAGYTDQGPRVIVEAMAAGLPVIAENRDGAADRVTKKTGWLIDSHDEVVELIHSLTPAILAEKGPAARARAQNEFIKEKWFDAISGV